MVRTIPILPDAILGPFYAPHRRRGALKLQGVNLWAAHVQHLRDQSAGVMDLFLHLKTFNICTVELYMIVYVYIYIYLLIYIYI